MKPNVTVLPSFTVLPQSFDRYESKDPTVIHKFLSNYQSKSRDPEHDLWFSVLVQAVKDYKDAAISREQKKFLEVFNWFFNPVHNDEGSFEWICDALDINPKPYLKALILWTKSNHQNYKKVRNKVHIVSQNCSIGTEHKEHRDI